MQILPCSIVLWHLIAAVRSETNLFSENLGLFSDDNIFSDQSPGATIDGLGLQTNSALDPLDAEDSNWSLDDDNLDLASGVGFSSNLVLADKGGLNFFDGSDPSSSPSISSEPDADLNFLVSSMDPTSFLQSSIWDDVNSPLTDNHVGCDVGLADDITLSSKRRRGATCQSPKGPKQDTEESEEPAPESPRHRRLRKMDPYVPNDSPWADSSSPLFDYAFPENLDICSQRIFKKSTFPVCKEAVPVPADIFTVPSSYSHLYNVNPIVVYSSPSVCPNNQVVWCCQIIQRRAGLRSGYNPPIVLDFHLSTINNLVRNSLMWYYDAYICFRHSDWSNGVIPVDTFVPIVPNWSDGFP